ncbi:hypothetical protein JUJ52_17700 [Virgibacillus sp. AGTR]|uniref:hypothetical protein n=1 Tax=Virgibacillus sp. AGTR TaxID=2812055 RepID=UPI001D16D305|nr:hypothetical protein [Virgibacillus sp. AGTR]MCC2251785.1 hypothetical protein [Virgibacillus sp. AGTR]
MKKLYIILGVAIVVIIFLLIENSHLKNESIAFEKKLEAVKKSHETLHIDSGRIAKNFINNYFNYKKKPNRKEVEPFATNQALSKLQFKESEGIEEGNGEPDSVKSEVSNLNIFYGKSVDDRQEIIATFENKIKLNGAESTANTVVQLDMKQTDKVWKVTDVNFIQY